MSTCDAKTTVTIAEHEDRVILTHTLDRRKEDKQPVVVVLSLDVVTAGELASQITEKIRDIGNRQFEKSGTKDKIFHIPSGRSHA